MNEITKEQFLAQRYPRRGRGNPERFEMPVWEWLVRSGLSAYQAAAEFGGPGPSEEGCSRPQPGWCFDRMGCTRTELPDGRVVRIAGEHEDSYDPDFYIYNDVIVQHPDGRVEIYGYPEGIFPPTDFHSATFDPGRNCIWIVGSLGYQEQRRPGGTPVHRLDLGSFEITPTATSGEPPGWIHKHTAELEGGGGTLRISRGIRQHGNDELIDQTDDWVLDLDSLEWRRDTHRVFRQWSVRRADGADLKLFEMDMLAFDLRHGKVGDDASMLAEAGIDAALAADLAAFQEAGRRAIQEHFDLGVYESLFQPPVEHRIPKVEADHDEEDNWADNTQFDKAHIAIGDCRVRYADDRDAVKIKVEGPLPPDVESALCADLVAKMSRLQGVPCESTLEWEQ